MQQMVGNLTHYDLIQRGKQYQELLHDEATMSGGREPDEEFEGVEVGYSSRPGLRQFVVGGLHGGRVCQDAEEDLHDLFGSGCLQEKRERHSSTETHQRYLAFTQIRQKQGYCIFSGGQELSQTQEEAADYAFVCFPTGCATS